MTEHDDRHPRLVSGHYWPCTAPGHPRDCPDCSARWESDAADVST